jgi:hypothetical protein
VRDELFQQSAGAPIDAALKVAALYLSLNPRGALEKEGATRVSCFIGC